MSGALASTSFSFFGSSEAYKSWKGEKAEPLMAAHRAIQNVEVNKKTETVVIETYQWLDIVFPILSFTAALAIVIVGIHCFPLSLPIIVPLAFVVAIAIFGLSIAIDAYSSKDEKP